MSKILIIDDTKNIRNMVRLTLEKEGHEITMAEDGEQGLELFGDGANWDLVLVDQRMPKVEGREVVLEARRRNPMARLIMMTAFASSELASEVLAAGAVDFLRKPFSTDVLRGAVKVALSQPHQESAAPKTEAEAAPNETPDGESQDEKKPRGLYIARVSWRVNGFSFWPLENVPSQNAEFGRVFQVLHPNGETSQCFVSITPHIREQTQQDADHQLSDDDPIWDTVCGQAILSFMWENAQTPPSKLPVYEATKSARSNRSPVPWGPFGSR